MLWICAVTSTIIWSGHRFTRPYATREHPMDTGPNTLSNFEIWCDVIMYLRRVTIKRTFQNMHFRATCSEAHNLPQMTSCLISKLDSVLCHACSRIIFHNYATLYYCPTKLKCSMCIFNNRQITFFCIRKFMQKWADDQCSFIKDAWSDFSEWKFLFKWCVIT